MLPHYLCLQGFLCRDSLQIVALSWRLMWFIFQAFYHVSRVLTAVYVFCRNARRAQSSQTVQQGIFEAARRANALL